jgi:hypothetical protein
MRRETSWGTFLEIEALSKHFNRPFEIYDSTAKLIFTHNE